MSSAQEIAKFAAEKGLDEVWRDKFTALCEIVRAVPDDADDYGLGFWLRPSADGDVDPVEADPRHEPALLVIFAVIG